MNMAILMRKEISDAHAPSLLVSREASL